MRKSMVRSAKQQEAQQIDLTPMLDVVFIMLIFFIVTATFIKEAGVQVLRPTTETIAFVENQKILIAVTKNNEIWLNKKKLDGAALKSGIQTMYQDNPGGHLVIQADGESTAEKFAVIYDAARKAGVPGANIHIATEPK